MRKRLSREKRILFNRIFVGLPDPDDVESYIENPQIFYIQRRFKEIDVAPIATELWMKLIEEDREFNWTYFRMKLISQCKKAYNKKVTQLKRETKGLNAGDIKTDQYTPEEWEAPVISWKGPLTEDEELMVACLEDGMTQREIYAQYKIHPKVQGELRESIRNKIIVTKWYEGETNV